MTRNIPSNLTLIININYPKVKLVSLYIFSLKVTVSKNLLMTHCIVVSINIF